MSCVHQEAIEDLALGLRPPKKEGGGEEEHALRAHLASCATCRREHALLVAERDLFARREEALPPPPPLRIPAPAPAPRAFVRRIALAALRSHALPAAAAAVVAFVGIARLGIDTASSRIDVEPPPVVTAPEATGEELASFAFTPPGLTRSAMREPLACSDDSEGAACLAIAEPVRASAPAICGSEATTLMTRGTPASWTCEAIGASGVTSSTSRQ